MSMSEFQASARMRAVRSRGELAELEVADASARKLWAQSGNRNGYAFCHPDLLREKRREVAMWEATAEAAARGELIAWNVDGAPGRSSLDPWHHLFQSALAEGRATWKESADLDALVAATSK